MKQQNNHPIYKMSFASIYKCYVEKVEKKDKTKEQLDKIIFWLMGYSKKSLGKVIKDKINLGDFIKNAPKLNPNRNLIKGVICGIRVEDMEKGLMKEIRYLDKLVDELARGKKFENILR